MNSGKKPKKILAVTGTRAEYGLLFPVLTLMRAHEGIDLQILATCMHMSEKFGNTLTEIEGDGFDVAERVDMELGEDTPVSKARSMGLGLSRMAEAFARVRPDAIMVLGDRYEILAAVSAAAMLNIPVIHLEGGHLTEGAIDDAFRHAITKLSHLHFTAIEDYRARIIQMGEDPQNVYAVGSTGLDNILGQERISRADIEADTGFDFGEKSLLVTFHPETLDVQKTPAEQIAPLFSALDRLDGVNILFTAPNADPGGESVLTEIEKYVAGRAHAKMVKSLGRRRYVSVMDIVDGVVGNSSSGIIEAPSFGIGTVNIGARQDGRKRAASIVDCPGDADAIHRAIEKILSDDFRQMAKGVVNPFGDGKAAAKIVDVVAKADFEQLLHKRFFDAGAR